MPILRSFPAGTTVTFYRDQQVRYGALPSTASIGSGVVTKYGELVASNLPSGRYLACAVVDGAPRCVRFSVHPLAGESRRPVVDPPATVDEPTPPTSPAALPLAMPRGFYNEAAPGTPLTVQSAADLYDSLGVNVHFRNPGQPYTSNTEATFTLIRNLGVRHIRDAMILSNEDFGWIWIRWFYRRLKQHNAAVPGGEQPIFATLVANGYPPNRPPYGGVAPPTVDHYYAGLDGGSVHYNGSGSGTLPGIGSAIPDGATVDPPGAANGGFQAVPSNWAYSDPEVDWSIIGVLSNANEPGIQGPLPTTSALPNWMKEFATKKLAATRADRTAYGGLPVQTQQGIRSGVKVKQIPIVGVMSADAGATGDWVDAYPDFTQPPGDVNYAADVGDFHPYRTGQEPSFEGHNQQINGASLVHGRAGYNGRLRVPADTSKGLPMFATEIGYVQDLAATNAQVTVGASHFGYWPVPPDVAAEYLLRHWLIHYSSTKTPSFPSMGVLRTYIYDLMDDGSTATSESRFGLALSDRTPRPSYLTLQNMLKLIGFSEPAGGLVARGYSVSGFTAGANNQSASDYSSVDRLDHFQLQQSNNTWLHPIFRQKSMWNFVAKTRPSVPSTQNLQFVFPSGITAAWVAQPTLGTDPANTGGSVPADGQTWTSLSITGGTTVTVPMTWWTKVLKVQS